MVNITRLGMLVLLVGSALPTVARAACIPEAKFEAQQPNHNAYVHTFPKLENGNQISIYLKGTAFSESQRARFLEVTRQGECILSIATLTRAQLDKRHHLYMSWSELEEMASNDNEGMPLESSDFDGGNSTIDEDYSKKIDAGENQSREDGDFEDLNLSALRVGLEKPSRISIPCEASGDETNVGDHDPRLG